MTPAGRMLLSEFDRIRIINLKERSDRRREVEQQLARLGLGFDDPQIRIHEATRVSDPAGFPSAGTRGCFCSHLAVLEEALETNAKSVLILEDDADFVADVEHRLIATLQELQSRRWSIFYGGHEEYPMPADSGQLLLADPAAGVRTTHFIALRDDAVKEAVPFLQAIMGRPPGDPEGGPMHVDGAYSHFRKAYPQFETWLAVPPLAFQRPSRTDVHDLDWFDRLPVVRELTSYARRWTRGLR